MMLLARHAITFRRSSRRAVALAATTILFTLLAARPAFAQEDQQSALQKITELNKQAIQEYQAGKPDDARKLLKQALDLCGNAGLEKHAIKARTHIHMGIVALMGLNNRDLGIIQFKKALDIQADIKLTKSLVTPEVEKAFEEAKQQLTGGDTGTATPPPDTGTSGQTGGTTPTPPEGGGAPAGGGETTTPPKTEEPSPLQHTPVTSGQKGSTIEIQVQPDASLEFSRLVLGYRPEGASDFLGREMKKNGDVYTAEIPDTATKGGLVSYYIEAQNAEGQAVANRGSVSEPYIVALAGEASGTAGGGGDEEVDHPPRVFIALAIGTGAGLASGKGDMDMETEVKNGFGMAKLGHISPEIGFFLGEEWVLSAQLRLQMVSGTNGHVAAANDSCGDDNYCTPGNGSIAGFLRLTKLFGEENLRPFVGLQVGGGYIRHVGAFSKKSDCGMGMNESCIDSVKGGPLLVGGHAGLMYHLTDKFLLLLRLDAQAGFSNLTVNFDGSVGFALHL